MDFVRRVFYFFSKYTDSSERSVGIFFNGLSEHSSQSQVRQQLYKLMQHDIAVINLWSEYSFKGYKYLRKSHRKKLYKNLELIAADFEAYRTKENSESSTVIERIKFTAPDSKPEHEKALLLQTIMNYFSPARGVYEYKASSSFGRLLRNPASDSLIGDCNQIVTLYIYIYSRYHDVRDLKIRLLPEHVALHYNGVDIEATNGTFANYDSRQGQELMPIEEIVSVNLLDTTDSYLATHEVAAEDFLQASRFAFILSHHRDIVKHNLEAAYGKLINMLMSRHNYSQALKFAKASKNVELLSIVGHNGAVYSMQQHHYAAARRYAAHALKKDELIKSSYHNEGIHHYQAHRYTNAITAFEKIGDKSLVQKCYEALFFVEQNKLGNNLTTESIKAHANTIKHMHNYAKKSGNSKLVDAADSMRKHL